MSNFECVVTIADIYGAEWWERNKAELDREWEWEFRIVRGGELICDRTRPKIEAFRWSSETSTHFRIILHRRKPKPPTLREVYGVDEVTIPAGWEWTGEWRETTNAECEASAFAKVDYRVNHSNNIPYPRLILRERPKKVWFKAEENKRYPKADDYVWTSAFGWHEAGSAAGVFLCATRHEEVDSTVQVVTQADIDKAVSHA